MEHEALVADNIDISTLGSRIAEKQALVAIGRHKEEKKARQRRQSEEASEAAAVDEIEARLRKWRTKLFVFYMACFEKGVLEERIVKWEAKGVRKCRLVNGDIGFSFREPMRRIGHKNVPYMTNSYHDKYHIDMTVFLNTPLEHLDVDLGALPATLTPLTAHMHTMSLMEILKSRLPDRTRVIGGYEATLIDDDPWSCQLCSSPPDVVTAYTIRISWGEEDALDSLKECWSVFTRLSGVCFLSYMCHPIVNNDGCCRCCCFCCCCCCRRDNLNWDVY